MKYQAYIPTEAEEQTRLVQYLRFKKIPHFAIPNGGSRNKIEGKNLKAQGVVAGVPDMMIPVANKKYHGLFIELKRKKGGVLSERQKRFIDYLDYAGYKTAVAKGSEEAKHIIENYLSDELSSKHKELFKNVLKG